MKIAYDVLTEILVTLWHVLPWLLGLSLGFAILSRWSPCNAGRPWWEKRGLITDLGYWIFVPIFTRYIRIWLTVALTVVLFGISDGQQISDFYFYGHGPVSHLPLWLQGLLYVALTDFALYWIHRGFHRGFLWKYHAVHHASQDLDWISAARFHPVNLILGTALVDVGALLCGVSPEIFVVIGPFNVIMSCLVHANLNWTFGPLRYLISSPVFHRWHHTAADRGGSMNFAGTFPIWDLLFGTFYMPENVLPDAYGIDDQSFPESIGAQLLYPFQQ